MIRILLITTLFFSLPIANAESIYKFVDKQGNVHYTSTKPSKDAVPAKLPKIERGEFKLAANLPQSCDRHGGANCELGTDKDGSVICTDGFRAAAERFRFSCMSPKLVISDISEPAADGELKVFVRNMKSVKAESPSLTLHWTDGKQYDFKGPAAIEPFGMAEFSFAPTPELGINSKPKEAQLLINCKNCG